MTTAEFIKQYNDNYEALVGYATKLCGNREDGLDIVQEAAIRAFKNRDRLESSESFRGWAYTIVKNTYINKFNKKKRRRQLLENAPANLYKTVHEAATNEGVSKVRYDTIMSRIAPVKEIYKKPFFLHFKGYSYEEISQHLNIPIGTIKSRIFTAKKKMQTRLDSVVAA